MFYTLLSTVLIIMANYWACLLAVALIGAGHSSAQKVDPSVACAGYELFTEKAKSCEGVDSLLTLNNFNVTMLENCTFVPTGSIDFKNFTTGKVDYDINFASAGIIKNLVPDLPLSMKNFDICTLSSIVPPKFMKYISDLGIPTTCPVTGKTIVADNDRTNLHILHDVAKHVNIRPFMAMAVTTGYTTGRVNVVHDTGVACLEFAGAIRKKSTDASRKIDALKKKTRVQIKELKEKMMKMGGKKPAA